jgi:hypothetical protein
MTPEEIQNTIASMLTIQKGLQESQIEFRHSLVELREGIAGNREAINDLRIEISDLKDATRNLNEISSAQERRLAHLVGYSLTGESERLDILQEIVALKRRVINLESKINKK